MLIHSAAAFRKGLILAVSFVVVFLLIFSPIFGEGRNGLVFSDDMFNKLSKGSSYFIPKIAADAKKLEGEAFNVSLKFEKPQETANLPKILMAAGLLVGGDGAQVNVSGDMGKLLARVLQDSDDMFKNDGAKVKERYGLDEKEVMTVYWNVLNKSMKELQKQKKIDMANVVNAVMKKGIEPSFNYYGIEAQSVADKAVTMTGLLVFYVVYTMWWGYAIFYLFEGIGLSMKKSKVKKEV